MSNISAISLAVSNADPIFTSTMDSDPRDIIFDVDGTLADATHRLHFIKDKPKDWDRFYEAMRIDPPIPSVVLMARLLKSAGHRIIICSGRPRRYLMVTRAFLDDIEVSYDAMYLRKDLDFKKDVYAKEQMLIKMRRDGYDPTIVFEDRKSVVDMWRAKGLFVFQVAEGNF